jgi:hypothetical protein
VVSVTSALSRKTMPRNRYAVVDSGELSGTVAA